MKIIVSAGHGEYAIGGEGVTVTDVWDPYRWDDDESYRFGVWATPEFVERVSGIPASSMPQDVDLEWEVIVAVEGDPADVGAALDELIKTLAEDPGGDDGTFDYWPSGVRMALVIDKALGGTRFDRIVENVRTVIDAGRFDYAFELYVKMGLPIPADIAIPPPT